MASIYSNYEFQLTGKLTTSWSSVTISADLERWQTVSFTDGYIVMRNRKWDKIERMKATASAGTLTISQRWLDQTDNPSEVSALKKEWQRGTIVYVTLLSPQIVDKQNSNTYAAGTTQTFSKSESTVSHKEPVYADATARDAWIPSPSNGMRIYNTAIWLFQKYQAWAWADDDSWWSVANASTTVAGKAEAPTQTEVEQLATTWGTGALVFVTPTTINPSSITSASPASWDKLSFSDVSDSNYLKSSTLADVIALVKANLFWFGTDGDVTIVWTVTLTRDMYYNNLVVPVWTTLDPDGYRIFVAWTISWTGTISRNGNSWANAVGKTWAAAATTLNQWSLNAEVAAWAWGTWWNPGAATAWTNGTSASPSMVNTNGVAWGAGGNWGAWGAWWTSTRWANYLALFPFATLHPATAGTITYENYKSVSGSWWWWGGYGQWWWSPYDGSWWWWGGGNWWFIWIAAYTWNFTGTITATWGAWWNGADGVVGGWGGWGGWGNWWTILRIYRTMVSDCTKTLTWWNWGTWWAAGSSQPAWANWSNWSTWVTIDIQI